MPQQNLKALQSKILQKAEMTTNVLDTGKKNNQDVETTHYVRN